ncbi:MAG: ribosome biogenesis GTPase Der [Candidatus Marinimicrobia bacterium]|nr:ribosome biogenesis GTPase Der [Candidatus Neomarinimicrobiota bacterium]
MNTVAIVGRPNVGKSTLYNRFLRERKAIVHETEGVTRDRTYAEVEWSGRDFTIIDTGGIMMDPQDTIQAGIREQALIATEEADLILFIVDVKVGITQLDDYIATILHKSNKKVLLVANKVDDERFEMEVHSFYALGFGEPQEVSALNGRSTGDLLDVIIENLPEENVSTKKEYDLKISILGMPNAGKSTIANTFLGKNRHIVTEIAGTTRDSINSEMKYQGKSVMLVDTAGLRKKNKISDSIEFYSFIRTKRAIRESHVCILMVDVNKGFCSQDVRIIQEIIDQRKGLIVAMNKWDLIEKETQTAAQFTKDLHYHFPILTNIPIMFISAVKKQRLFKLLDEAFAIKDRMKQRISTSELNNFFLKIVDRNPPPSIKGKYIKIKYVTQVLENPPLIAFFSNAPTLIMDNYKRYLESVFRKNYDFKGVPIKFIYKNK